MARSAESNGSSKSRKGKSTVLKWKGNSGSKQANGFMKFSDDWQETGTFAAALEKVESWIFSRIVESVWWQVKKERSIGLGNCELIFIYNKVIMNIWMTLSCFLAF